MTGMAMTRRLALGGLLAAPVARAKEGDWPSRPVRFVVPYPPGGQSFLMNASIHVIIPHLNRTLVFDALADFTPVTKMASVPLVAVVNPQLPVRSIPELIAYLKAHPGRVSYASSGNASALHLAGEMFKLITGTDMVHVPYRGAGPAVQDLIAGNV